MMDELALYDRTRFEHAEPYRRPHLWRPPELDLSRDDGSNSILKTVRESEPRRRAIPPRRTRPAQ